jgi:hypothetical protein
MMSCAGDESRQVPPFRLPDHSSDIRLLSGCESVALANLAGVRPGQMGNVLYRTHSLRYEMSAMSQDCPVCDSRLGAWFHPDALRGIKTSMRIEERKRSTNQGSNFILLGHFVVQSALCSTHPDCQSGVTQDVRCSTTPSWQGRPAARLPLHPSRPVALIPAPVTGAFLLLLHDRGRLRSPSGHPSTKGLCALGTPEQDADTQFRTRKHPKTSALR